jgi:hypothetical protein
VFIELTQNHSDIEIKVELVTNASLAEPYETTYQDKVRTKYKLKCINRGQSLSSNPNEEGAFKISNGTEFELKISKALYDKLDNYLEGEILLIVFVTKANTNNFWKVEPTSADSVDINEDYEKQKMANTIQRKNSVSTTDDRIAWAVAINNATKLVSEINVEVDEKIKLIEDNTARIYELVKSLDTYLSNQTEESNNETSNTPKNSTDKPEGQDKEELPF